MDTADPAPDKSALAPTPAAPPPDRNTPRETEPASSPDRLPPFAPPDRYTAPRNSPHTAPKNLPRASESPPQSPRYLHILRRHRRIIRDPRRRHLQRAHSAHMRLNLQHCLAPQQPQTIEPIRHAPREQVIQPRRFLRVRSHNQFPAHLMRNPMSRAELHHLPRPRHTKPRLQRSRLVINPAVDHSAIVSRLMPGPLRRLPGTASFSRTTTRSRGNRSLTCMANESPTIPPPTTAMS